MPTPAVDREAKVRAALEQAQRIHADYMSKMDGLRKQQLQLMESALGRMAKERAATILSAIQNGTF